MVNFREIQNNNGWNSYSVKIDGKKITINITIDRGGRIINCDRINNLYHRIYGKQYISLAGLNTSIHDIIYDELTRTY